ncbi:hypothetical protein C8R44DRAFT_805506 [Mycena epipterygia]|nr:hypothetical protein C8R44DRAFT_805506 [Mycena epipterygia]
MFFFYFAPFLLFISPRTDSSLFGVDTRLFAVVAVEPGALISPINTLLRRSPFDTLRRSIRALRLNTRLFCGQTHCIPSPLTHR